MSRYVYYGRELYHAATGQERKNHQYIARIPFGDKFRYFYNQAELAAYKAGKAISNVGHKINVYGPINQIKAYGQLKKNASLRNPNEKKQQTSRSGKTTNPFGYGLAVARRTVNPIVKGVSDFSENNIIKPIGKAVKTIDTGIKKIQIESDLKSKGVGKTNSSLGDLARLDANKKHNQDLRQKLLKEKKTKKEVVAKRDNERSGNSKAEIQKKDTTNPIVIKNPPKSKPVTQITWDEGKYGTKKVPNNYKIKSDDDTKPVLNDKKPNSKKLKQYEDYYYDLFRKDGFSSAEARKMAKSEAERYVNR